jgi:hypothetical protein
MPPASSTERSTDVKAARAASVEIMTAKLPCALGAYKPERALGIGQS